MNMLKKASVAIAAIGMAVAPVASANAQQADLRADTVVEGNAMGEGAGGNWILILIAVGLFGLGIVTLADGGNNSPTSP
jgi:hypothetical protein